jgi:hypothetical protein
VSDKPTINIKSDEDIMYALEGARLLAFRWRAGQYWYVAGPGRQPQSFDSELDSMNTFLQVALGGHR